MSAAALERFADCPVKWLVESVLDPEKLAPDPEQMVRGQVPHSVLEHTFQRLREETGERRVSRTNLARAERILLEELHERRADFQLSPKETRVRAAARRLEFDLLRYLRSEADSDSGFEPDRFELEFGIEEGDEPVEIAEGLRVRGRIDRVDTNDGMALVLDYKGGKRVDRYKAASWERENRFQAALYMLSGRAAARAAGSRRRLRGARKQRSAAPRHGGRRGRGAWFGVVAGDRLDSDDFREKLDWALSRIRETDDLMRRGQLCAQPDSCAWNGGCSYPSICRSEQ